MTNREIIKAFEDLLYRARIADRCQESVCTVCDENERVKSGAWLALEALKQSYPKINKDYPIYAVIDKQRALGRWVCDSLDHNDNDGCSNPSCFKYYGRTK